MKIAFVTGSECQGGASRAAIRLIDPWRAENLDLILHFAGSVQRPGSGVIPIAQPGRLRGMLEIALGAGHPLSQRLHSRACRRNLFTALSDFQPDLIHVHNINPWYGLGFSRGIVAEFTRYFAPVVWTLHDAWALNGARCYDMDPDAPGAERDPGVIHQKLEACGDRLTFVSPSKWLADRAMQVFHGLRTEVIPYAVDTSVFFPVPKAEAAAALGWDPATPRLIMVGDQIHIARKGIRQFAEACIDLKVACEIVVVGTGNPLPPNTFPKPVRWVEPVSDDRLLAIMYNAADAVVVPSREDNLPCVILESLACGVPVVGTEAGGIPELVDPARTGWRVPLDNPTAFTAALAAALRQPEVEANARRKACRAYAEEHLALPVQLRRYRQLAREILA